MARVQHQKKIGILLLLIVAASFFYSPSFILKNYTNVEASAKSNNEVVGHSDLLKIDDCLSSIGFASDIKLYSQNDEDGALLQILRCMGGHGKKEYFEFGSEDGSEVNTRVLRDLYGWKGHLLDGGNKNEDISLHQEYFTPSNIVSLLEKYEVSKDLDVLSVDCDYDDFFVAREILVAGYKPRVLITEYNVNFGPEWAVSVPPKPIGREMEVGWNKDCHFGGSAKAMFSLARTFGYTPVWSNDVNLMFVQLDQALELNMIIPSINRFPGPRPRHLHRACDNKKWKLIDENVMNQKAADPMVSHTDFAESFSTVTLKEKFFRPIGKNAADTSKWWRKFYLNE